MKKIFLLLLISSTFYLMSCGKEKTNQVEKSNQSEEYITVETNNPDYYISEEDLEGIYALPYGGRGPSVKMINYIVPIRNIAVLNDSTAYIRCICDTRKMLILFPYNDKKVYLNSFADIILTDKWHEKTEFENVKKGTLLSHLSAIDDTVDFKVTFNVKNNSDNVTNHYCKDGCYTIEWEENAEREMCVKSIEFTNDRIIADIVRLGL